MWIVLAIFLTLCLLYALSLRGRRNHPGLAELRRWHYAHRGLHDPQLPENSMAAFRAALDAGYGIELDIHLLADGNLAVMHDASLKRTAGADVQIESLTTPQLTDYHLGNTQEPIPTFHQVLDLFDGKAPLIVELKTAGSNYAALTEAACNTLADYKGAYCLESFDPRCIRWLKENRPELIRGQLSGNYFKSAELPVAWYLRVLLTCQLGNFLLLPDFVAYRFSDRKTLGNFLVEKLWGIQSVAWTLKTPQELETAVKENRIAIFEGFRPQPPAWEKTSS